MDVAIESLLDGPGKLPETLVVCGYARMELPSKEIEATHALDRILEGLDEEHSDPDGDGTEATDKMKAAAVEFAAAILDEYTSWACEIVERKTINVQAWVKENRPDWEFRIVN